MTNAMQTSPHPMTRLNPAALALAFGVAGVVVAILFGAFIRATWGMMGGGGSGGWMHGSAGGGPGYGGSMMGGGLGFSVYALVCGFLGGAIAGAVSAWVYNAYCSAAGSVSREAATTRSAAP